MKLRQEIRLACAWALIIFGLVQALPAAASVVVGGTRVIFNGQEREATVKLSNAGVSPALVQVWLDAGDSRASPSSIEVPFTVTPPVSRIDPGKAQTLRIVYTGEPLPQDTESVFWLNVLEIPPKPSAEASETNRLQIAFRTRIKMFFRPAKLDGSAQEAPARVTWRLVGKGKDAALEAHNPTQYYVSYDSVELVSGDRRVPSRDGGMVGPGKTQRFPLTAETNVVPGARLHYRAINDWGGPNEGELPLTAAD